MSRKVLLVASVALFALPFASAAVTEIGAMTVTHSWIDMDLAGPVGPTTLAAVNAAGTGGGANIADIDMAPGTAAPGIYGFQATRGNALGYYNGVLSIISNIDGPFDALEYLGVDLGMDSTEFGFSTGDWSGPVNANLFSGGAPVGTIQFDFAGSPDPHYLQMTGGTFDRVEITCWPDYTGANWVTPDLYVQVPEPTALSLLSLGALALLRRR